MRKKIIAATLAALLLFVLLPTSAFAAFDPEKITSKYVILEEASTGTVLFEKASTERAYPASTTKIMTCLLALESGKSLDDVFTVGKEVYGFTPENSLMHVVEGEKLTMRDLLYGMMLVSGNDAAATIAINIAGSEENFAAMMNKKAQELGMVNTHFITPNGLHRDEHYTTAADMAKLVQAALKNPTLMKIVGTKKYTVPASNKRKTTMELETTNKFISGRESDAKYANNSVTGMKTGHTNAAKACLVTTATKNGITLIVVVFYDASADKSKRWTETQMLLDYGFENFKTVALKDIGLTSKIEQLVDKASSKDEQSGILKIDLNLSDTQIAGSSDDIAAIKADPTKLEIVPLLDNALVAPITAGQKLGTAAIKYNGITLATVDLTASRDVQAEKGHVPKPTNDLITAPSQPTSEGPSVLLVIIFVLLVLLAVLIALRLITNKRLRKRQSMRRSNPRKNYYGYNHRNSRPRY